MRQSEQEITDTAIEFLEHFRSRIGMYIGRPDIRQAQSFLTGFGLGIATTGVRFVEQAQFKVWKDRGWEVVASGPVAEMVKKGMDVNAIIHELVEIEMDVLRRYRVPAE